MGASPDELIRFEEPASGFSAIAPPDFELRHEPGSGAYELRCDPRGVTFQYRRLAIAVAPLAAAYAEAANRGLTVTSQMFTDDWAALETTTDDGRRWTVHAAREEDGLRVAAYGKLEDAAAQTPEQGASDQFVLWSIWPTARGGRPPATTQKILPAWMVGRGARAAAPAERPAPAVAESASPIPLKDFRTDDGTATGKVPDEPGWHASGSNGALYCGHPQRGELWMGLTWPVTPTPDARQMLNQAIGFGEPSHALVAPMMTADQAVIHVWPRVREKAWPGKPFGDVRVTETKSLRTESHGSFGDFRVTFTWHDAPWRGYVRIGATRVHRDDQWQFSCSSMAIPVDGDQRVWDALLEAWAAFRAKPVEVVQPAPAVVPPDAQAKFRADVAAILEDEREHTARVLGEMRASTLETYATANAAWSGTPTADKKKKQ